MLNPACLERPDGQSRYIWEVWDGTVRTDEEGFEVADNYVSFVSYDAANRYYERLTKSGVRTNPPKQKKQYKHTADDGVTKYWGMF